MVREEESRKISYIREVFAQEDEVLSQVGKNLPDIERRMQIGSDEGAMLHGFVKMIGAKKVVELGVLAGYSSIWMARALPKGGKIYAIEKDKRRIDSIRDNLKFCGVDKEVSLLNGDAVQILEEIKSEAPFDLIFIDADKGNYNKYLDWAEENIRKGGLIIADNTFLFGAVYGETDRNVKEKTVEQMRLFNERLADRNKFTSMMIPTKEGLLVSIKNI